MSDQIEFEWVFDVESKIRLEVPKNWLRKPPRDPATVGFKIMAPDESAAVDFVFISKGAPEAADHERRIMVELEKNLTDMRPTLPAGHAMQNGLRVFGMTGVAKTKAGGMDVNWYALAYGDGQGHAVLVTILLQSAKVDEVKPITDRIATSIGPYTPPAA